MVKCWLDNKTCVITGASSGIGRYLSKILIEKHNCHIIGVGRSKEKMENFVLELKDKKDNFEYKLFDVSIEKNWIDFAKFCSNKNIDVLINNAGVLPPFSSISKIIENNKNLDNVIDNKDLIGKQFESIMQTNFMSVVYGTIYLMPMIEKSTYSAIINIASSSGLCALSGTSIYSASKAAVKNFTECLASEKKYYVGLVCPGFTKTEIFRNQTNLIDSKLIDFFSSSLEAMGKKIYRGIKKRKKRMVYGIDAKAMDFVARHYPSIAPRLFSNILKKSKIKLFKDVFED